ncbi:MAG: hypothetical protein EU530_06460 [Promethearchaeota archaeon]|nr:MAG: hypothetical protein EU530_06460 [Candidatus Lokiarchaeota archaeon]
MQRDKVKETLWTIHSRGKTQKIELRYTELSGIIQSIVFKIKNKEEAASLNMTPTEFQKIYMIFQSFHDLLISSDLDNEEVSTFHHTDPKEYIDDEEVSGDREINTDDWDPW